MATRGMLMTMDPVEGESPSPPGVVLGGVETVRNADFPDPVRDWDWRFFEY